MCGIWISHRPESQINGVLPRARERAVIMEGSEDAQEWACKSEVDELEDGLGARKDSEKAKGKRQNRTSSFRPLDRQGVDASFQMRMVWELKWCGFGIDA